MLDGSDTQTESTLTSIPCELESEILLAHIFVTHHHANLSSHFLIHSLVQDNVHELIKATEHSRDVPVGIELN